MEEIRIDGVIGDWNNTVGEIQWRIEALGLKKGDDLKVIINSIGGSVFEGFAINKPKEITLKRNSYKSGILTINK